MKPAQLIRSWPKDLDRLQERIGRWQDETFGKSEYRSSALINHLGREVRELELESALATRINNYKVALELADILILTIGLAEGLRINLFRALIMKMSINLTRKWKKPDKHGVIEHDRKTKIYQNKTL